MRGVRIYGEAGRGSFAQVTSGMLHACEKLGVLAGFVECRCHNTEAEIPGSDAVAALSCGPPGYLGLSHTLGMHRQRWLMLAPNSEGFPLSFRKYLCGRGPIRDGPLVDGLRGPSRWAAGVLQRTFPDLRVLCAPHGVRPMYRPKLPHREAVAASYRSGAFYVTHLTSTGNQRKGTRELMEAWRRLKSGGGWHDAKLAVLSHPMCLHTHVRMAESIGVSASDVSILAGLGFPDEGLVDAYSHTHIVCQPSRAEGFGLVPVEARACGVPVVATACTGHEDHMLGVGREPPGTVVIAHGPDGAIDDFDGATAPTVSSHDVELALVEARTRWESLSEAALGAADDVRREWAWEQQNASAIETLIHEAEASP